LKKIFVGLVLCVILTAFAVALELDVWLTGFTNEQMRIISDITESQFTAQTGIHVNYVVFTVAEKVRTLPAAGRCFYRKWV